MGEAAAADDDEDGDSDFELADDDDSDDEKAVAVGASSSSSAALAPQGRKAKRDGEFTTDAPVAKRTTRRNSADAGPAIDDIALPSDGESFDDGDAEDEEE